MCFERLAFEISRSAIRSRGGGFPFLEPVHDGQPEGVAEGFTGLALHFEDLFQQLLVFV
jgi:hypothetical protein